MSVADEVVRYSRLLYERGHLTLLSGNLSALADGLVVVTPTSFPKPFLEPSDLVWIDMEGRVVRGVRRP
ncbi:MAG: class II aldolase/adducin family protein, partial [Pyrobaculum sp.]